MPTRRTTLKTLAGAAVVGSLSGCVQLATQRTVEYNGTPAMMTMGDPSGTRYPKPKPSLMATGVEVEARRTIERVGVTRELVAHSWGMLYSVVIADADGNELGRTPVATFTTPSIQIAGQELNPIKDLTVGDIGNEIRQTVVPLDDFHIQNIGRVSETTVEDATGRKVLRTFREALGGENDDQERYVEFDVDGDGTYDRTLEGEPPDWNGDTYNIRHGKMEEPRRGIIRFDKHEGDFVVLFESRTVSGTGGDMMELPINTDGNNSGFHHPSGDEFNRAMLHRHLVETNLQGMQGMVKQARKLIDETQELLVKASNETRNEANEKFQVISDTRDDLMQLDTILGGLGEDLSSISWTTDRSVGVSLSGNISGAEEKANKAVEIVTRARNRVTNYTNSRTEEDDHFSQIESNLGGIMAIAQAVRNGTAWPGHGLK